MDTAILGISACHIFMVPKKLYPLASHMIFIITNMITGSISVPATRLRISNVFFMDIRLLLSVVQGTGISLQAAFYFM